MVADRSTRSCASRSPKPAAPAGPHAVMTCASPSVTLRLARMLEGPEEEGWAGGRLSDALQLRACGVPCRRRMARPELCGLRTAIRTRRGLGPACDAGGGASCPVLRRLGPAPPGGGRSPGAADGAAWAWVEAHARSGAGDAKREGAGDAHARSVAYARVLAVLDGPPGKLLLATSVALMRRNKESSATVHEEGTAQALLQLWLMECEAYAPCRGAGGVSGRRVAPAATRRRPPAAAAAAAAVQSQEREGCSSAAAFREPRTAVSAFLTRLKEDLRLGLNERAQDVAAWGRVPHGVPHVGSGGAAAAAAHKGVPALWLVNEAADWG